MRKVQLLFIPSPGLSHLISTVEAAKLLLHRDGRLSITVLIIRLPNDTSVARYTQQTSSDLNATPRLRLLDLPDDDPAAAPPSHGVAYDSIDRQAARVRETIVNLTEKSSAASPQLAGIVVDMFCTNFIDIAREFSLPSYVFFTSGACGLAISRHLIEMRFEQNRDLTQLKNSDLELSVPYFKVPVPAKVLPAAAIGGGPVDFINYFKKIGEADGIMVNTFHDLESYAIDSLNSDGKTPRVYPVGPILNQSRQSLDEDVKKWLDEQTENSVVFLCFGTMGSLDRAQVREISLALEICGFRFLWSLRKGVEEYENFEEVLPEGFLERTKGVGKVIGWAAQVAVLSHAAVGGFVSHCGWNSILESIWFGVPIATFPLYAEQQLNAFYMVEELGMAEAITVDYHKDLTLTGEKPLAAVGAEEIAAAIRRVKGVREKVVEMRGKAKAALEEGGSSYNNQNLFIQDVISNIST